MPVLGRPRIRFAAFELDTHAGELFKHGLKLKLQGHPIQILAMLLERPGDLITREEIRQKLWPSETETFVDFEHGLNNAMRKLRQALGDEAETPKYVETLPRRGYRFVGQIAKEEVGETPEAQASAPPSAREIAAAINQSRDASSVVAAKVNHRTRLWIVLSSLAVILLAAAAFLYYRAHRAPTLTEKDTVVVGDFTNTTGDVVFIDTLRQGLLVQLSQSPFLNILSDDKVRTTLKQMGRQPQEWLSDQLAREVCARNQSKVFISGSIASLGSEYVLGLKAVNCQTGEVLVQQQTEVARKENVLYALGKQASVLRRSLGESLASIQKYDVPLEEATTSSLEALQAYSLGYQAQLRGDVQAIPFYLRAIELDPTFALAYAQIAAPYFNTGQMSRATESIERAFALRDRVSEHERLRILAYYHWIVTGELEKAKEAYEVWQQIYPHDIIPYVDLTGLFMNLGQWEQALAEGERAKQLAPDDAYCWGNMVFIYLALNRSGQAEITYQDGRARGVDVWFFRLGGYYAAFVRGDFEGMRREAGLPAASTAEKEWFLAAQSDTEAYIGRLAKGREFSVRAIDSARALDALETAALFEATAALREAEFGSRDLARRAAHAALVSNEGSPVRALAALALARARRDKEARQIADSLERNFPGNTLFQNYWIPSIRAAIELNENNADKALYLLGSTTEYELSQPPGMYVGMMYPVYLRGLAFLQLADGTQAAAAFQRIVDHPGIVLNTPAAALAHLGLARAYGLQGDMPKARAEYETFLTLWKNADPDIPTHQQAEAEYTKLR